MATIRQSLCTPITPARYGKQVVRLANYRDPTISSKPEGNRSAGVQCIDRRSQRTRDAVDRAQVFGVRGFA